MSSTPHRGAAPQLGSGRHGVLVFTPDGKLARADEQALVLLGDAGFLALSERVGSLFAGVRDFPSLRTRIECAESSLHPATLWRVDGSPLPALLEFSDDNGNLVCRFAPLSEASIHESIPFDVNRGWVETLMEISQAGVFITDLERYVYVNRAFAELLGFADPVQVIGAECRSFVHEEDLQRLGRFYGAGNWEQGPRETTFRVRTAGGGVVRDVAARIFRIHYGGRPCFVGSMVDVTDLRRSEAALHDYASRLQVVSRQIMEVQENERSNLARELHDEIGQQLTLLKISMARLRENVGDGLLDETIEGIDRLMSQVRDLSLDLRPSMLDDLGLAAALRWYVARAARLADIRSTLDVPPDFPRMRSSMETLFFRVAQEAITNVLRHSGASCVRVRLDNDGHDITLDVIDDGQGFEPDAARSSALAGGSAGLLGMQERAALAGARLQIESAPGRGTRLHLTLRTERAGLGRKTG